MSMASYLESIWKREFYIPALVGVATVSIFLYRRRGSKPKRTGMGTTIMRSLAMHEPIPNIRRDYLANSFLPFYLRWVLKVGFMRSLFTRAMVGVYSFVVARTIFFDRILEKRLENIQQVVNMGAGFDSRALRYQKQIQERGIKVFELDLPPFSIEKRKKLIEILSSTTLPNYLQLIPVDLSQRSLEETLNSQVGYDPTKKTLFIWEGVVCYLPQQAVDSTLAFISKNSAPGSVVAFDYNFEDMKNHPENYYKGKVSLEWSVKLNEPFLAFVNHLKVNEFAASRGFKVIEHHFQKNDFQELIGDRDWFAKHPMFDFIGFLALEK